MTSDIKYDSQSARDNIPIMEWIVAAIGGLLVIASFGFLVYRAVVEREPPSFEFTIEKVERLRQQSAATVSIRNNGGQPVADLRVQAIGGQEQSTEVVVDYVPAKSSRRVTFVFDKSTVASEIKFLVDSFTKP